MTLRTVIVDDEPLARRGLRVRLAKHADFTVIGEAANGREAVARIRELQPDVVFLDVQMPGLNGFDVVRELGAELPRHLVFVTAFDQYAVEAFRVRALDYLLKPVESARFEETLTRIREVRDERGDELAASIRSLVDSMGKRASRIVVKSGEKSVLVSIDDLIRVEAEGDYVRLFTTRGTHLHRATLKSIEHQLDERFLRVHRSAIVRIEQILEVHPLLGGESMLVLRDGTRVRTGRSYRDALRQALGDV